MTALRIAARTFFVAVSAAILIWWMYSLRFEAASGGIAPVVARRTTLLFSALVTVASCIEWEIARLLSRRARISALLTVAITACIL